MSADVGRQRTIVRLRLLQLLLLVLASQINQASAVQMLSKPQSRTLDVGQTAHLECEFLADNFNLFDNPIVWRKRQRLRYRRPAALPSSAVDAADPDGEEQLQAVAAAAAAVAGADEEDTQINMMGNLVEPFASSRRFRPTFQPHQTSFVFGLTITNISTIDVGNYSCEVGGPQNSVLGSVTHQLFVRANVDYVLLTDDDNRTSVFDPDDTSPKLHKSQLVYVEDRPGTLRCVAVGGHPPPAVELRVVRPGAGGPERRLDLPMTRSVAVGGQRGLRLVRRASERGSRGFLAAMDDDGAEVKCVATVPGPAGLSARVASSRIVVHYSAVIECSNNYASVGERNVFVRCDVRAKPEVLRLHWTIDDNGTTVSEGEVINEYWTLVMDRSDGVLEVQLFMRQARPESFRTYTLVAENGVAVKRKSVKLAYRHSMPPEADSVRSKTEFSFHKEEQQTTSSRGQASTWKFQRTQFTFLTLQMHGLTVVLVSLTAVYRNSLAVR